YRQNARLDAGFMLAILLPVVSCVCRFQPACKLFELRPTLVRGEIPAVQQDFGIGDAAQELPYGPGITAERGELVADDVMQMQTVSVVEGPLHQLARHSEAYSSIISGRSEARVAELVDVEGKLGADMGVRILLVGHHLAVFLLKLREFLWNGYVDRVAMSD